MKRFELRNETAIYKLNLLLLFLFITLFCLLLLLVALSLCRLVDCRYVPLCESISLLQSRDLDTQQAHNIRGLRHTLGPAYLCPGGCSFYPLEHVRPLNISQLWAVNISSMHPVDLICYRSVQSFE